MLEIPLHRRAPRIYVDAPIPNPGVVELTGSAARHVGAVLRLKAGAAVTVFNGRGGEYPGELLTVKKQQAQVRIRCHDASEREAPWPVCLALCVSKGAKMDLSVQKATELGATRIQPLIGSRSVVRLDSLRAARRRQHWSEIVISASEQCGRNRLTEIAPVMRFEEWLASDPGAGLKLVFTPQADLPLGHCESPPATGICLLIGPEGGFSDPELSAAVARGFQAVTFGARTLRAETAAIAGLAAVLALWSQT